jgi:hypothetical protein
MCLHSVLLNREEHDLKEKSRSCSFAKTGEIMKKIVVALLLLGSMPPSGRATSATEAVSPAVMVDLPVQLWTDDYLAWMKQRVAKEHSDTGAAPVMLGMPYLELFSPTGKSLYRGSAADKNASFLTRLSASSYTASGPGDLSEGHPGLADYFTFIGELRPFKQQVFVQKKMVLLAVTFPDKAFCKAQNEALLPFLHRQEFQVVEIKLHS